MLITIDQLEVGDEILVPTQSSLRFLKVLRKPRKNKKTGLFGSVLCSVRVEEREQIYNYYNGVTRRWKTKVYVPQWTDHNKKIYQDLKTKHIYLVKRNNIIVSQ